MTTVLIIAPRESRPLTCSGVLRSRGCGSVGKPATTWWDIGHGNRGRPAITEGKTLPLGLPALGGWSRMAASSFCATTRRPAAMGKRARRFRAGAMLEKFEMLPTKNRRMLLVFALSCGAAVMALYLNSAVSVSDDEPADNLAPFYGFGRLELYKLQQRSVNLLAADLNDDGRTDLISIDNSNSRLDLLQQRVKPESAKAPTAGKINAIESDKRFEHKKIAVDREVASLAIGDFNGDGRKDLAYFGAPDQLTVILQTPAGDWTSRKRVRLADVQPETWIVAAGDLNGDRKDDLAVLGKHDTYLLYQQADGELAPPTRLMNTGENLGLAQIADLDGDGRNDLCYLSASDADRPLCV